MTRNAKLSYLRRRKAELEQFNHQTEGVISAHRTVMDQIYAILTEGQEVAQS